MDRIKAHHLVRTATMLVCHFSHLVARALEYLMRRHMAPASSHLWSDSCKLCKEEHLVFDRHQIEAFLGENSWQRKSYQQFRNMINPPEDGQTSFPCVYALMGWKSSDQRYVFVDGDDVSEARNLRHVAAAMREYLKSAQYYGPFTTLVVLCRPSTPVRTIEQYNLEFWKFLHSLCSIDSKPWPVDVPVDTQSANWSFCFDGVPWFPTVFTPAHIRRRSRHAPNLTYVMQPKWIFDALLSTPEKRSNICERIRKRVSKFDEIPLSPNIAHHGELGTTESTQYYLLDENKPSFCPYEKLPSPCQQAGFGSECCGWK